MIRWLTRQRDNMEKVHIPGAGILPSMEGTREQWITARDHALDRAGGYRKTAEKYDSYVEMIDSYPGARSLDDVLEALKHG